MPGTASYFYQRVARLGYVAPISQGAGTVTMTAIDLRYFDRLNATVMVGVIGSSATVDFKFQGCATSGGSYADIDATNCAIPQITASGKIATLELMAQAVVGRGFRYIKGILVVGVAATLVGVLIEGVDARYEPANQYDLASVISNTVYIAP